ncbi:hypothetical protein [Photobacterium damselae]|uniref:hypothetical protein n=2 Tax=Photobacterium damselae TaxID=38293 RepID=UPI0011D15909|nr:hypothetical protein [Photobacterium damselae]KAB1512000.1 hypothetical protein FD717_010475 [Photobacterium damselae subsp. damselae]
MQYPVSTQINQQQTQEEKNMEQNTSNQAFFKNKQRGASLENFIFWMIAASLILVVIVGLYMKATSGARNMTVKSDVGVIIAASQQWGGNNKTGISMTKLCEAGSHYLTNEICGAAKNGTNANPFGGNYAIKVDPANPSRVQIDITGIDANYVNVVANDLAPLSFDNCRLADGCATLKKTGNSVTLTR